MGLKYCQIRPLFSGTPIDSLWATSFYNEYVRVQSSVESCKVQIPTSALREFEALMDKDILLTSYLISTSHVVALA